MEQTCPVCTKPFKVYPSQKRTYCSIPCMKVGYVTQFRGKNNPNFRHGIRQCATCGKNLSENTVGDYCQKCQFKAPGYENPFKGKSHSDEVRKRMSENQPDKTGFRNSFHGRHHEQSARDAIGAKTRNRWQTLSDDKKEEVRGLLVKQAHAQQEIRWTRPERKIANWLSGLGISWQHNALLYNRFFVDFLLDSGCVIEVFGDYWHGNTKVFPRLNDTQQRQQAKDKSRMAYLSKCGHRTIVLWEKDIKDGSFELNQELRDSLKNIIVRTPICSGFSTLSGNT